MKRLDISALGLNGLIEREWIVANGIGGFASSTVCGLNTRKYHGLLVAAMTPPVRRMVLLSHVEETVRALGKHCAISSNEYPGVVHPEGYKCLRAFSPEPFPRWAFQCEQFTLEKSLRLVRGENTVCLSYTLLGGDQSIELDIRPLLALRGIHELMFQWNGRLDAQAKGQGAWHIPPTTRTPEIFFAADGAFWAEPTWYLNAIYRREEERGYAGLEDLWNPGVLRWTLTPGQTAHFVCSSDPVDLERVLSDLGRQVEPAVSGMPQPGDEEQLALLRAADSFVCNIPSDAAPRPVAVIWQYPWSAPSPRASLIAFGGLFLVSGRFNEGRLLLEGLAPTVKSGLIPSEFPENGGPPVYQGADVSLWFVNAVHEYLRYTADHSTGKKLLPVIESIIQAYRGGTELGIKMDADGLVGSQAPGLSTSWMDAKVGNWVITPRQGRTVELNALWFNALKIAAELAARYDEPVKAAELTALAEKTRTAFNQRFWNEALQCCYDVVEDHGPDASLRPNQIFALSLPHPVLAPDRQHAVLAIVARELLTPLGLRTLSPRDPAYQGRYVGNVVQRDRAQHQGSAHPWLLGPMIAAYLRVNGRAAEHLNQARQWIGGCLDYLQGDGVGQIGELFDGSPPHRPGGAVASALSIGEILRCYVQDIQGIQPANPPTPALPLAKSLGNSKPSVVKS